MSELVAKNAKMKVKVVWGVRVDKPSVWVTFLHICLTFKETIA